MIHLRAGCGGRKTMTRSLKPSEEETEVGLRRALAPAPEARPRSYAFVVNPGWPMTRPAHWKGQKGAPPPSRRRRGSGSHGVAVTLTCCLSRFVAMATGRRPAEG